jgi:membrane AbrB-like protein
MVAAIWFAARGHRLPLPSFLSLGAQALVGLLVARSLDLPILMTVAREPWLFLGGNFATLAVAVGMGWMLARWQVLPASVAMWGSMPGAATTMVMMARDRGAEWQLVAVMAYLRVVFVATIASLLAATVAGHGGGQPPGGAWFPAPNLLGLGETVFAGIVGVWGARRIGLPAAALLGPMIVGAVVGNVAAAPPQLPGWLLAPAYLLVGWRIGLGFTPEILRAARRAAPRILLATGGLVLFCAGCGLVLARLSGRDEMSAYLAMSPGGADSVAIIASATPVDVSFVMAMQVMRFITVLLFGPALARALIARSSCSSSSSPAD